MSGKCERCERGRAVIEGAGYRVSLGSRHSDEQCFVFSIETCGPDTYGHPRMECSVRADGAVRTTGGPRKAGER